MFKITATFPVLVCGGRGYRNRDKVNETLDSLHTIRQIDVIIEGAAEGADTLAEQWAKTRAVPYVGVAADWEKFGKRAGPIRNSAMLDIVTPKCCVAFPGNNGTADMTAKARKLLGCYVLEVEDGPGLPAALQRRMDK